MGKGAGPCPSHSTGSRRCREAHLLLQCVLWLHHETNLAHTLGGPGARCLRARARDSIQFGTNLTKSGPTSVKFDQHRPGTGQNCPQFGQLWHEFDQILRDIDTTRPTSAWTWPTLAWLRPNLVRLRPTLSYPGRRGANYLGTLLEQHSVLRHPPLPRAWPWAGSFVVQIVGGRGLANKRSHLGTSGRPAPGNFY